MNILDIPILAAHAVLLYAWVVFPALLAWASRRSARSPLSPAREDLPSVTIILSAYNEEAHMAGRIRNLLAMRYPAGRWKAYIGVDGSKDRTAAEALAAAAGNPAIQVFDFAENRGKIAVLKDLVGRARAASDSPGILVFTDANTNFEPEALARLVAPFSDPAVGGVCGRLEFVQPEGGKTDENIYWKFENWLKARESAMDSCLGANGAIYAIRAPLFWSAVPSNTIVDDFVLGMKVREQGLRLVYEPRAIATELLPPHVGDEWKRRVRIGSGNYQSLALCRACLAPSFGPFALAFWSHKVLRWFTPHLLLLGLALAAFGAVSGSALGVPVLRAYAMLATASLTGYALRHPTLLPSRLLRGIQYFIAMQAALLAGFLRFCAGNLEGRWQRTIR
jgi:cellulose synthase/poly-beta-1,6-N-acetylglucosamine synthase-like glycosyltransferase